MGDDTKISWASATWNPILGCSIASPGCTNCYAVRDVHRMDGNPNPKVHDANVGLTEIKANGSIGWTGQVRFLPDRLSIPLRWKRPRGIFVNALSDLFHPGVPNAVIDQLFAVMSMASQHHYQVLTKRADRMRQYLTEPDADGKPARKRIFDAQFRIAEDNGHWRPEPGHEKLVKPWPLRNVSLGVSVESVPWDLHRIPDLLMTPAGHRILSLEPLLGPLPYLGQWLDSRGSEDGNGWATCPGQTILPEDRRAFGIAAVIVGGESGPSARPMHPDWVRTIRDQCRSRGVTFHFKQWGEWIPAGQPRMEDRIYVVETADPKIRRWGWPEDGSESLRLGKSRTGALLDGKLYHDPITPEGAGRGQS